MTPALRVRLLLVFFGLLCGGSAAAAPFRLEDFAEGLESHPDYALSTAEGELADAQLTRERASGGARLYGNLGSGSAHEPQFAGGMRDYNSMTASLGLRYPLFGSAGEERLRVGYAGIDALLTRVRRESLRRRLLQDLRIDYHAYARAQAQQALARQFLADAPHIRGVLARRVGAGLLREAERGELELGFAQAERQQAAAAAELRRLGQALRRWRPDFGGELASAWEGGLPAFEGQPEEDTLQALQALQTLQDELDDAGRMAALRANAYVGANGRRDTDLGNATGLSAGINFELPLDAIGVKNGVRRESAARVQRARLLLQGQAEDMAQWREALAQEQLSAQSEVRFARASVAATGAALREASERAQLAAGVAGDPIERWIRARNSHYTALAGLLAAQARLRASAAREQAAAACVLPDAAFLAWAALQTMPRDGCASAPPPPAARRAVYAWSGMRALEAADSRAALDELAVADIWLSLSAEQLRQLAQPALRQRLAAQIREQQRGGRRVALLLGDPDWLREGRGDSLLALATSLADLPFDALHLDLEPAQLSAAERAGEGEVRAWRALAQRIAELRARLHLPVIASIHWRALAPDAQGLCAACAAAERADAVAVMLYSTSAASARERMARIAAGLPGKPLWLAQSIEPELGPDESHFGAGRGALRAHLADLQDLATQGAIAGFAVQSLETYLSAAP